MAERPVFFIDEECVRKRLYEFEWFSGFAVSQKQKSIKSLHQAVKRRDPSASPLEISTKGEVEIGRRLSAFNLKLDGYTLENVFQSSKVFEKGGPYTDLLEVSPKEAKRDPRLKESGALVSFRYLGKDWPLFPKTVFYDYIYYQAVKKNFGKEEIMEFMKYNFFTDIEFNPNHSINTQARSAAIVRLVLEEKGELAEFVDPEEFIAFHRRHVIG